MKIAIDIDEVLCEFVRGYLGFLKSKGYNDIEYEDISSFYLYDIFDISEEDHIKLIGEFGYSNEFSCLDLVLGAKEGVDNLNNNFEIFFITSRLPHQRDVTGMLLKERFGLNDFKLFFSSDVHGGDAQTKDEYCKENGIGVIIEDNAEHSVKYANNGIKVILFDKPWNQGVEHENITRVNDWSECLKIVEEMGCVNDSCY